MVFYRAFEHGFGRRLGRRDHPAGPARLLPDLRDRAGRGAAATRLRRAHCAWLLARYEFRGKRLLDALIDLPFAVSPVVVGLALILVWGRDGWFALHRR